MTQRLEPFWKILLKEFDFLFLKTQRIEPFTEGLKELNFFFQYVLFVWLKDLNFSVWPKELNFFLNRTDRIEPFFFESEAKNWTLFSLNMTQRIKPFFLEYDAKNWTLFPECDSENWTIFLNMTPRIESFFLPWLKEWNLCFQYENDSTNSTFLFLFDSKIFLHMPQRIEPFFVWLKEMIFFSHMTQRMELFFEYDAKNGTFFECDAKNGTIFLWIWRKDLNHISLNMTQRLEPLFFDYDAKNWTLVLWIWRKELNPFSLSMTQRIEPLFSIWLKELNLFFEMTQRIETSRIKRSKNWTFF